MANVYFIPVTLDNPESVGKAGRIVLEAVQRDAGIQFEKKLPLKVHFGEPGNTSYVKPKLYDEIINYLKLRGSEPYYIETCTATGPRSNATSHKKIAKEHGFTQIPVHIADGENGFDYTLVPVENGSYFHEAKIAKELADAKQVLVLSHFKGHSMSGFGGALKMLGIGFACARGKIEQHSKVAVPDSETIQWDNWKDLYTGTEFRKRTAEYAQAAVRGKKNVYVTFAVSLVANCDCDGEAMQPLYNDVGVLASLDPVAIDAAALTLVKEKVGKIPFKGEEIIPYAQKLGLGNAKYNLVILSL